MKRPNHAAKPATTPELATPTATPELAGPTAPQAKPATLTLAIVEPAAAVEVALAELDPSRFVTARVKRFDPETVANYAERMLQGDIFPPVELFRDETGLLWLGDGLHRFEAASKNGWKTISARVSEGGQLAALKHAAGANESHGLRRTPEDKRQAVLMVLADPVLAEL